MRVFSERSANLIRLYSWNNIFFKYFRKSVIYILIPLTVLSLIICANIFRSYDEKSISEKSREFRITSSTLETVFNDVENNHTVVSSSSEVINYTLIDDNSDFETEYYANYDTRKLLKNICISSQYIQNIHLYLPLKNYVFSTLSGNDPDNFFLKEWLGIYSDTGISDFVYYNTSETPTAYSDSVIIVKPIIQNDQVRALVMYDINAQIFRNMLPKKNNKDEFQILTDANGIIFYSDSKEFIGKNINDIKSPVELAKLHGTQKINNTIYLSTEINFTHKFISAATVNNRKSTMQMAMIVAGVALFVLLISFLLSFYLSLQFYQSIIQITATLRNDQENGSDHLAKEKYEELYYINSHIVSRLTKKDDVEKHLSEQITSLKKAQFVALQTQLNPHFIYNTLNLINVMVMSIAKRETDANRAIVILSQLLREALDTKKYLVSLGDEFEYVNKYIELQKLKFKYDIDIIWDIDDSLLQRKVLKFMLQPIVENAFEHGFNQLQLDKYILIISAHVEDDKLTLSVTNNGKKIESDELCRLQQTLDSDALFDQKGIGLVNVNHRIRLIYGDEYGCSIESGEEQTTIKISLPQGSDNITEFSQK